MITHSSIQPFSWPAPSFSSLLGSYLSLVPPDLAPLLPLLPCVCHLLHHSLDFHHVSLHTSHAGGGAARCLRDGGDLSGHSVDSLVGGCRVSIDRGNEVLDQVVGGLSVGFDVGSSDLLGVRIVLDVVNDFVMGIIVRSIVVIIAHGIDIGTIEAKD
jgi:hypothetical protein